MHRDVVSEHDHVGPVLQIIINLHFLMDFAGRNPEKS